MQDESSDVDHTPNVPELTVGCWIVAPEGEAVLVEIGPKYLTYRYPAVPFRDGKPQVLEQSWVLTTAPKGAIIFRYPPNIVSIEVAKLKGPYGRGEKKQEPLILPFKADDDDKTWD